MKVAEFALNWFGKKESCNTRTVTLHFPYIFLDRQTDRQNRLLWEVPGFVDLPFQKLGSRVP